MPSADILIEAGDWPPEDQLRPIVEGAVAAVVAFVRPPLTDEAEVSLVFTDDAHVETLNRRYREKNASTNVLSFPAPRINPRLFGPLLGDIVVAEETVAKEATADGLNFDSHLTHLIVHGFLHLLGYDHETEPDAAVMEKLETAILARLGIADPYAEKDG